MSLEDIRHLIERERIVLVGGRCCLSFRLTSELTVADVERLMVWALSLERFRMPNTTSLQSHHL